MDLNEAARLVGYLIMLPNFSYTDSVTLPIQTFNFKLKLYSNYAHTHRRWQWERRHYFWVNFSMFLSTRPFIG